MAESEVACKADSTRWESGVSGTIPFVHSYFEIAQSGADNAG